MARGSNRKQKAKKKEKIELGQRGTGGRRDSLTCVILVSTCVSLRDELGRPPARSTWSSPRQWPLPVDEVFVIKSGRRLWTQENAAVTLQGNGAPSKKNCDGRSSGQSLTGNSQWPQISHRPRQSATPDPMSMGCDGMGWDATEDG